MVRAHCNLRRLGTQADDGMSDNSFDPHWTSKVTVPVKRVGERWEFFYGGDVPVCEGALGELTLSAEQITDERFKQRLTQELLLQVLEEGTELRIALSDRGADSPRAEDWPERYPASVPSGTTRFVPIWLAPVNPKQDELPLSADIARGGLWLKLKGLERCELQTSAVRLPNGCSVPTAISLNHAFTVLSERYERHRISHTGNVYARIFYKERNDRWYPLDDLRRGVQAEAEQELLASTWQEVEQLLGWRPVAPPKRRPKD